MTAKLITEHKGQVKEFSYQVLLKRYSDSEGLNIASAIISFSLFSSLEDMSMGIELSLVDAINLIDDNYLQVGSILDVTLFKSENDDANKKITDLRFYVTNIDGQMQSKEQKQKSYDVAGYTFAAVSNEWPLLKKIPEGMPSDMIKEIVEKRFVPEGDDNRIGQPEDEWVKTANTIKGGIIFHQVKPFDAISQLLKKCVSAEPKDNAFFFFEDYEGFKLKTLGSMTKEDNLKRAWKYTFYPEKSRDNVDVRESYFRVLYLSQYTHTDYFHLIRSGILRSELIHINLLTKEVKSEKTLSLTENLEDYKKDIFLLGNNNPIDTSPSVFGTGLPIKVKDLEYDFTPSSYVAISESAWERDDYLTDKYMPSRMQKELMKQTKITIEVYGNPAIRPGDIVNLSIPAKSALQDDKETRRQSGNFIVWAVKHTVNGSNFQTIVDLCKDAYEIDINKPATDKSGST